MAPGAERKFWGWGWEGEGASDAEIRRLGDSLHRRLGFSGLRMVDAPRLSDIRLREPRVRPPASLSHYCAADTRSRAEHTLGKSLRDYVRGLRGRYDHPPDFVAYPAAEADLVALLDWAATERVAVIPYGGGSSVVDGIEPRVGDEYRGAISADLRHLDRVLEVDTASRSALIEAGTLGPQLEDQLRPHGLSLRFFPQSFEFSSLGGWIATRAGGHFATMFTQADDFVEALRVITPQGLVQTRRLPSDGAGVSADRMFIGSEGTLGLITQAWMRLQHRPGYRAGTSVHFGDFERAWHAVRAISQSGLWPSNCRLLDRNEALHSGAGDGSAAILVLAFESADHPMDPSMDRALQIAREFGGSVPPEPPDEDEARRWRHFFLRGPYLKEGYTRLGVIRETFETACTWDRFPEFHAEVMETTRKAVEQECGTGIVACRFTHVYPDGPAPYYTVIGPARDNAELDQWATIKQAASEAVLRGGGTITHHHAVGRYHRPWYDQQRPELFAAALRSVKATLDPAGVMNPGVLIEPR